MTDINKSIAITLVNSALTGQPIELPDDLDYAELHRFAVRHNIVVLVYYGLVNSGMDPDSGDGLNFFISACQYISLAERQDACTTGLFEVFEEHGIDYMPLKGTVIKSLYPNPEMRAMGDADILIRKEQYEQIVELLEQSGYSFVKNSNNEYVWSKRDFCLELHRYLLSPEHQDYFRVIGDGWLFAQKTDSSKSCYFMKNEDFFVHLVVHFAKHYRSSGIGIRHVTDIWLFLKAHPELDFEYVKCQLDKLKLTEFCDNIKKTAEVWFGGNEHDAVTELMTEKILQSGAFGTADSLRASHALKASKSGKNQNRFTRFVRTVFLPYRNMCLLFPVLKKVPVFLPFLWVWRIIYTAVNKKGRLTQHYNSIKSLSADNIKKYEQELQAVGLEYRFEEDD